MISLRVCVQGVSAENSEVANTQLLLFKNSKAIIFTRCCE